MQHRFSLNSTLGNYFWLATQSKRWVKSIYSLPSHPPSNLQPEELLLTCIVFFVILPHVHLHSPLSLPTFHTNNGRPKILPSRSASCSGPAGCSAVLKRLQLWPLCVSGKPAMESYLNFIFSRQCYLELTPPSSPFPYPIIYQWNGRHQD